MTLSAPPKTAWNADERHWNFGRFAGPIEDPAFRVRDFRAGWLSRLGAQRFRLKEWTYASIVTDRLFVALGVVQLGYAANAFAYAVDRTRPEHAWEFEAISPLGRALEFASSSAQGETHWNKKDAAVHIHHGEQTRIDLDVPLVSRTGDPGLRLRGGFRLLPRESFSLLHDLGDRRPAYTHKLAGMEAHGGVLLGEEAIDLDGGTGVLDWTRSLADRETRWKWASFAGRSGSQRVGLNLSAEVYDDAQGQSRENALYVDGDVTMLGGVKFNVGREPGVDDWTIRSMHGDDVDLRFRPLGARAQHLDLRLVRSHFVQPYGIFSGRVKSVSVEDVFGVVEDHHSVW